MGKSLGKGTGYTKLAVKWRELVNVDDGLAKNDHMFFRRGGLSTLPKPPSNSMTGLLLQQWAKAKLSQNRIFLHISGASAL